MNVDNAIDKRRAYRALKKTEITPDIIKELGKAAQFAPSCFNKQPWRFVFITGPEPLERIKGAISEKNSWAFNASMIIAVVSEAPLDCRMKDGRHYYLFDTGIACGFLMLKATELGLVAHPMAGYDQAAAKELLDVPESMTIINIIAVGKHDGDWEGLLTEDQIITEASRPKRKPLSDIVFIDSYGNSL